MTQSNEPGNSETGCDPVAVADGHDVIVERSVTDEHREVRLGVILGLISAVGYTGANLALRQVAVPNDIGWALWVTANKAVPAALVGWLIIIWRASRGLPAFPPRRLIWPMIIVGLLMQYGGNLMFQWSLSLGGLAVSVPLCFAALIVTGAWLGRIYLGDSITPRTLFSISLLVGAIFLLSSGAGEATETINANASTLMVVLAIVTALVSGASYAVSGVMIRHLTRTLTLSASIVIFSTVGVVVMGIHSLFQPGVERIAATTVHEWWTMIAAGWMNALAFFALAGSLKRISVTFSNVVNASQNAICAAAGVILFSEPPTVPLVAGCVLTVVGMLVIDSGRSKSVAVET